MSKLPQFQSQMEHRALMPGVSSTKLKIKIEQVKPTKTMDKYQTPYPAIYKALMTACIITLQFEKFPHLSPSGFATDATSSDKKNNIYSI